MSHSHQPRDFHRVNADPPSYPGAPKFSVHVYVCLWLLATSFLLPLATRPMHHTPDRGMEIESDISRSHLLTTPTCRVLQPPCSDMLGSKRLLPTSHPSHLPNCIVGLVSPGWGWPPPGPAMRPCRMPTPDPNLSRALSRPSLGPEGGSHHWVGAGRGLDKLSI